jgi:hypothetical protein
MLAHPLRRFSPHAVFAPLVRPLLLLLLTFALPAPRLRAAPQLWLPTPPGQPWKIIQGYGCGTHDGWDRYSLDLVSADGPTRGAVVRAAADGTIWAWTGKSGTLILAHGGFYTMYTHMESVVTTERGRFIARGTPIGAVGNRGAPGVVPHLHFTAFVGAGVDAHGRRSIPLSFAEGYDLPEVGGCGQHGGEVLTAASQGGAAAIRFSGAEPGRWYNSDLRIEFAGAVRGFSQAWDRDPGGAMPTFPNADSGYMQLAWAGEGLHTLYVRAWDAAGRQTLATYGPIGYDITQPSRPPNSAPVTVTAGAPVTIRWSTSSDGGSGMAGYRVYIGAGQGGTSEWFTPEPQIQAPALGPGRYLLRVQPLDYAGNAGPWRTIGQIFARR